MQDAMTKVHVTTAAARIGAQQWLQVVLFANDSHLAERTQPLLFAAAGCGEPPNAKNITAGSQPCAHPLRCDVFGGIPVAYRRIAHLYSAAAANRFGIEIAIDQGAADRSQKKTTLSSSQCKERANG